MKTGVLRTFLLWLMILIIPAQVVAGGLSVSCSTTTSSSAAQTEPANEHGHGQPVSHDHHAMAADSDDRTGSVMHGGCVLCATSCHGISALTSATAEPLLVVAPAGAEPTGYLAFVGQAPEPPKRPPRTAHL